MFEQRIFVDLDGVMANFDKRALEILGKPFIRHDNSIWDTLEKYQDFFQGLEPMPDAFTLWREIEKFKPIILTAIPRVKRFPWLKSTRKSGWNDIWGNTLSSVLGLTPGKSSFTVLTRIFLLMTTQSILLNGATREGLAFIT